MKQALKEFDDALGEYIDAALLHGGVLVGSPAFEISKNIFELAKEKYVKANRALTEELVKLQSANGPYGRF